MKSGRSRCGVSLPEGRCGVSLPEDRGAVRLLATGAIWGVWLFCLLWTPSTAQGQTLSIRNIAINESVGYAIFKVTLSGTLSEPVFVNYRTVDGTAAVADGDYQRAGSRLEFTTGNMTHDVKVRVFDDTKAETNEDFFVVLYNADGATISRGRGRCTLLNDDPPLLSISDMSRKEEDNGTVNARFKVTTTGDFSQDITVDYKTVDGSATAADLDYQPKEGTLTIDPEDPAGWIEVPIIGDTKSERDENFWVYLSNPFRAEIKDGHGQGTIENDDPLPMLSINDVEISEGDVGTTDAVFEVTLSGEFSKSVKVEVHTADGTATVADQDYVPIQVTLNFEIVDSLAQEIRVPITVPILGDRKAEPDEYFFVRLSNVEGALIKDGEGVGTILNDDPFPELSISDTSVKEGDGPAVFTVTLDGEFSEEVEVSYETVDGTATAAGGDYEPQSDPIRFMPDGKTTRTRKIEIPVNKDEFSESKEAFSVRLFDEVRARVANREGVGTIYDDDVPPTLSINDGFIVEGDSGERVVELTVALTGALEDSVTVTYETIDGTATVADGDYVAIASEGLVFHPGGSAESQKVQVEILGDTQIEGNELFSIRLAAPTSVVCEKCEGRITIEDDDMESRLRWTASSALENSGVAVVTVERIGAGSEPARVTVTADSKTATVGEDFTATTQVLTWEARESGRQSIQVPILDDNVYEGDESLVVRFSDLEGAEPSSSTELELVILDDDQPMQLEVEGNAKEEAGSNGTLELKVRAVREDGQAVQGLEVAWRVVGDADLLDGEITLTDLEGFARQRVRVGATPGTVVVTAEILLIGSSVSFEIEIRGGLATLRGLASPGQQSVARVLDESCGTASGDFEGLCDYVFELDDESDQVDTIVEMTPEEVAAQSTVSQSSPLAQIGNISARLAALRSGARGFSAGQLAMSLRGTTLGVGQIRESWASRGEESEWLAGALELALAAQQEPGPHRERIRDRRAYGSSAGGAAESRWGFFMSGKIAAGERPESIRESGFDFETLGLTTGADYRFSPRLVGGFALGYLDTETEIFGDGGQLEARGYSLSTFGMFYVGDFSVEGVLSFGRNEYDQSRNVDLPQPFQGQSRFVAQSRADGDQFSLGLQLGYELAWGGTSLAGTAGLIWIDAEVDGFLEQGAGPFNLRINRQEIESLQSQARLELSRAISVKSMGWLLNPTLSLAYLHEFEDDSRPIRGSFSEDLTGNEFEVPTEPPDRDFFRLSAGFTVAFVRGRSVFLLYEQDLDRQDLDAYSISFGLRLGL